MALRDDILRAVPDYPLVVNVANYRDGLDPNHPDYNACTVALLGRPLLGRVRLANGVFSFSTVTIRVSLVAGQCWVRRGYWNGATPDQKSALTAHEQGHVDVAFFIAWHLARSLLLLQTPANDVQLGHRTPHQAENILRNQANTFITDADILGGQLQESYENQTAHGTNTEAQGRWTALFQAGLPNPVIPLEDILRNNRISRN